MILSKEQPEIYKTLHEKFGVEWDSGVIITYGDTVYCKYDLPEQKIVHEQVHIDQQKNPKEWWEKYLLDPKFRLFQEVQAYRAECRYLEKTIKDRNKLSLRIHDICKDISSSMYGGIVPYAVAKEAVMHR
jgi:hypothetical protein